MNVDRLRHAVAVAKQIPPDQLNMNDWWCGTVGCIAGHLCQDPEIRHEGLRLFEFSLVGTPPRLVVFFGEYIGFTGLEKYFDIEWEQAEYLFGSDGYEFITDIIAEFEQRVERIINHEC